MIPNRQITINTSPVQSLQVGTDSNGNISYWNRPEGRWVPVTDQRSIDSIVRALPAEYRAAPTPAPAPPQPGYQPRQLTRDEESEMVASRLLANAQASREANMLEITADIQRVPAGAPGRALGQWLIANRLTYNEVDARNQFPGNTTRLAVLCSAVKSNDQKTRLEGMSQVSGLQINSSWAR
jgi:hypothetical protein